MTRPYVETGAGTAPAAGAASPLPADLKTIARANGLLLHALAREDEPCSLDGIRPFPEDMVVDARRWNACERNRHFQDGLALVAQGKVAVITLAGGQGTRLGSPLPKGCFDVGTRRQTTLFDLQAGRIRRLEELARLQHGGSAAASGSDLPPLIKWAVMTSPATHQETVAYFRQRFPPSRHPVFFQQGQLPCFTADAPHTVLENQAQVCVCLLLLQELILSPDGNGGVFEALKQHGILDAWRQAGVEHVHVYCVDNVLARVADPCFMAICAAAKAPCGLKVVEKTDPTEKVGILALGPEQSKHSGITMVEYSELPPHLSALRRDSALVYRLANIASHYFTLEFLEMAAARIENSPGSILPAHIARKNITVDGAVVAGIKLERFIFDILQLLPSPRDLAVMLVSREDEFSPLKNASAPGKAVLDGTPEACRNALDAQHRRLHQQAQALLAYSTPGTPALEPHQWYLGEPLDERKLELLFPNQ